MWPCSLIILRRRQEAGCRETQYPFILADDHARTAISAYGGINSKLAPTPNIDAIGENGAIMQNMLCTNSISGPSRACLLTGKYSTSHGFYQNEGGIVFDNTQQQYQKILRDNGYTTALFGKWHLFPILQGSTTIKFMPMPVNRVLIGTLYIVPMAENKRERLCHETYHDLCFAMA